MSRQVSYFNISKSLLIYRWHNHINPAISKAQWTDIEEIQFIEAHRMLGNRWSEIAKMIPGRTDNAIKNHFYSGLRKNISRISKEYISFNTFETLCRSNRIKKKRIISGSNSSIVAKTEKRSRIMEN